MKNEIFFRSYLDPYMCNFSSDRKLMDTPHIQHHLYIHVVILIYKFFVFFLRIHRTMLQFFFLKLFEINTWIEQMVAS